MFDEWFLRFLSLCIYSGGDKAALDSSSDSELDMPGAMGGNPHKNQDAKFLLSNNNPSSMTQNILLQHQPQNLNSQLGEF